MTGKSAHLSWLAVAAAFLGLFAMPAAAYTISSQVYSEGLAGSYTELDYGDIYEGACWAYVEATLYFDGNYIASDDNFDPSFAFVEVYSDAGPGSYVVLGGHWIYYYYYGWVNIDETSGTFDNGGDGGSGGCEACPYPTEESSVYAGSDDSEGYYSGEFYAYLTPNNDYTDRKVQENVVVTGETCNYYLGGPYPPITYDAYNGTVWTADADEYGEDDYDYVGAPSEVVDYYLTQLGLEGNPTQCWAWYGTQAMSINDCVFTDEFTEYDSGHTIGYGVGYGSTAATAYRGGASGPG